MKIIIFVCIINYGVNNQSKMIEYVVSEIVE